MGEVWLGRDRRLGRTVAVKAVRKERRLDEASRARFLREARILSQLDHPNICRLYDYLEEESGQYLVLEHVSGSTLSRRIEEGIPEAEKIDIAIQISEALAAAHAMSVVHRDLKPANVMISDDGTVKVLDFGLARPEPPARAEEPAAEAAFPEDAEGGATVAMGPEAVTRDGTVLGTLEYMSPEQARGEPATAASDVFTLGLLLHELFTGTTAYPKDLPLRALHAKAMWGERAPTRSGNLAVDDLIGRLSSLEPGDRPSASAAAEELRRIREAPRLRRRRRLRVTAVALLTFLTLALAVLSVRLRQEVSRANREARTSSATADFLASLFELADPFRTDPGEASARELLDRGVEEIHGRLGDEPATRTRLLGTMGKIYTQLGDYDRSVALLEEALSLESEGDPSATEDRVQLLLALAHAHFRANALDAAEEQIEAALSLAEGPTGNERLVADLLHELLMVRSVQGRYGEAEEVGRRCLALRERLLGPDAEPTGITAGMLGVAILDAGRHAEAEELLARAVRIAEAHHPPEHPTVTHLKVNLATALRELGRLDEAEAILREVLPMVEARLGSDHPDLASYYNDLGITLLYSERWSEAEGAYRKALEIAEKRLGEEHPLTGMFRGNVAEAIALGGRPAEAEPLYRSSLSILRSTLGERHPILADPLRGLALVESALGRPDEAEALLREAISIRTDSLDAGHPDLGRSLAELGRLLQDQGRDQEATPPLRQALEILAPALGEEDETVRELRARLATADPSPSIPPAPSR